jgi:hypothetical protein
MPRCVFVFVHSEPATQKIEVLDWVHTSSINSRTERSGEAAFAVAVSAIHSPSRAWKMAPSCCVSHQQHLERTTTTTQQNNTSYRWALNRAWYCINLLGNAVDAPLQWRWFGQVFSYPRLRALPGDPQLICRGND